MSTPVFQDLNIQNAEIAHTDEEAFVFSPSFTQERLWLLDRVSADRGVYNSGGTLYLKGQLIITALEKALKEIAQRHEILQTNFRILDGSLVQIVKPTLLKAPFSLVDLSDIPKAQQWEKVEQLILEDQKKEFNLEKDILWRIVIIKLDDFSHILNVTMHHIICDGWSMVVFLKELSFFYRGFTQGNFCFLPELSIQYGDFSEWQRERLTGEVLARELEYWQKKLNNAPSLIDLPTDYPRPAVQSFRGKSQDLEISKTLLNSLKTFSNRQGVTLFTTLLTLLKVLLFKWTGQTDLVVGTVIANRNRAEIEPLIGCFMNLLALRSHLSSEQTLEELLQQVKATLLEAYSYQDCPFEKVVEVVNPDRKATYNPVYNVALLLQNFPVDLYLSDELIASFLDIGSQVEHLDLRWIAYEADDKLILRCQYNTDIFSFQTIARMLGHFEQLIKTLILEPTQPLGNITILTPAEQHQILSEWNQTQKDYPQKSLCLHQLIELQAENTPESIAVIFGDKQLTYRQLNEKANQLAHYLQKLGVQPEVVVGICLERSLEMVVGLLAILKAGGAYVPLDPEYPSQRLAFMLNDAQVAILLTQQKWLEQLPKNTAQVICLDKEGAKWEEQSQENPNSGTTPKNLAYVIYTSGSTGQPKGAMNTHQGIVNRLLWMQDAYQLSSSDRVLQKTPFSFDVSVWEFFWPLLTGARLIIAQPGGHRDSAYLKNIIEEQAITTIHFVPSMLQIFLEEPNLDIFCKSLKRVICSGESLPLALQKRFFEHLDCQLHNLYGPTEASVDVTYWACQPDDSGLIVPIGRPIANTQLYILDKDLKPVPVGAKGELHIGGVGLARGYLNRGDLTKEKFISSPFSDNPETLLYKTGDVARYRNDGNIEYLGRIDHQVKLRGFRIELGEIESALAQHIKVNQAIVIAKSNCQSVERLIAYIVPNLEKLDTISALIQERILEWEAVFEHTYQTPTSGPDGTLNFQGWRDSYTGNPIPAEEMNEWVESTVERVLALHPQKVLEIGCGTGMLLFRIALYCSDYWGTDISKKALDYIEEQMQEIGGDWSQVSLYHKIAHELDSFKPKSCDTIILNSVVQLFPSIDYLVDVLAKVLGLVKPGGFIFIGDVRNLNLLESFHNSIQYFQAADSLTCEVLQAKVKQAIKQEEELVISPEFFYALRKAFPRIAQVQIQLKRSQYDNELTRFRYDVVLKIGEEKSPPFIVKPMILNWTKENLTLDAVYQILSADRPPLLRITNIPNPRLDSCYALDSLLASQERTKNVGELRTLLTNKVASTGIDPEQFWALDKIHPYQVTVTVSPKDNYCYDVWLQLDSEGVLPALPDLYPSILTPIKSWRNYANNPLHQQLSRELIPELRQFLSERLPDYMVPSAFVLMESMPLNANGKVDRKALPDSDLLVIRDQTAFIAPRSCLEETLASIWQELLGLEQVSIKDNFFAVGGHSLLATQVINRIKDRLSIDLPLGILFEKPTIEELGDYLELMLKVNQEEREEIEL